MIPLRDQEAIRQRFQRDLNSRVRLDFFTQRRSPLQVPGREECTYCDDVGTLLREVASLSERITLSVHDLEAEREVAARLGVDRVPATVIRGQTNRPVRFFGIPTGGQFVGFVETLIDAARGHVDLPPAIAGQLRKLRSDLHLQVFVTPSCPVSPPVSLLGFRFGLANPRLSVDVIEAAEYPTLLERYGVQATPTIVINERATVRGGVDAAGLLRALFQVAEARQATPVVLGGQGRSTPLPQASGQPRRPTTTSGGLILPR